MKTTKTWDIKKLTENITPDLEWERMAPHKLFQLNKAKYDQNPPLRKRLIETAPHRLIEASTSKKWGGGGGGAPPFQILSTTKESSRGITNLVTPSPDIGTT